MIIIFELLLINTVVLAQSFSREQYDALVKSLAVLNCDDYNCPMPAFNTTCPEFCECDYAKNIVNIDLAQYGLQSLYLPTELGDITSLRGLHLQQNYLRASTLPTQWSRLTKLDWLSLFGNPFQRPSLPPQWSSLTALTELEAQSCNIGSTLPKRWATLTNLQTLFLDHNALEGSIPNEWLAMPIDTFSITHNYLRGRVPEFNVTMYCTIQQIGDTNCFSHCPTENVYYIDCCDAVYDDCPDVVLPTTVTATIPPTAEPTTPTTTLTTTPTTRKLSPSTTTSTTTPTTTLTASTVDTEQLPTIITTRTDGTISADDKSANSVVGSGESDSIRWLLVSLTILMFGAAVFLVFDTIRRRRELRV